MALQGCIGSDGPPVEKPLSYVDLKYAATVRQRFDFSCGAATLATMLTHYWGRDTSELEVLAVLRSRYPGEDWAAMEKRGFSIDDLIWAAGRFGFKAQGAELPATELEKADGPLIVHLNKGKFEHFSVLRTVKQGTAYLSDPVLGAVSMPLAEFARQYTGHAVAVWKEGAALPGTALLGRPVAAIDDERLSAATRMEMPYRTGILGR